MITGLNNFLTVLSSGLDPFLVIFISYAAIYTPDLLKYPSVSCSCIKQLVIMWETAVCVLGLELADKM